MALQASELSNILEQSISKYYANLNIDEIGSVEKESRCIPEFVKPEGITDDEMIDYIADHTLFKRQDVIQQIEGGRDLDIFYFDIKNRENN